ncbi:hypothetical protein KKH81_00920 [Patescibacteria group bacterium]|nr:hypothetical protein [Patescibacteria group bacterium]
MPSPDLDEQPFSVRLPHGDANEGETLHEAALRIADETEVGRYLLVSEPVPMSEASAIDRHFYLVEPDASARKRSWVIEQNGRRVEYSWIKREHASDLADGLGDFLDQLPQAA